MQLIADDGNYSTFAVPAMDEHGNVKMYSGNMPVIKLIVWDK